MANKSSQSKNSTRATSSRKTAVRKPTASTARTSSVTSKKAAYSAVQSGRNRFVGLAVLVAAILVAISVGLLSYHRYDINNSIPAVSDGRGILYLRPVNTTNLKAGSTVSVAVYENSGTVPVDVVQSDIQYPADKLQIMSVDTASSFPSAAATDIATPGLVRLARAIEVNTPSVQGARPVATLQFKVLQATAPIELDIDQASSLLVRSSDSTNILPSTGSSTFELE
jgi:hypothetical protein